MIAREVPGERRPRSVELDRQWPAFDNGTLAEDGTLRSYEVRVRLVDPGVDLADRGYDDGAEVDRHHPQVNETVIAFDGDGFWDRTEERGLFHPRYGHVDLDPNLADTDADGLLDNQEVGEKFESQDFGTFYTLNSRPDRIDTDGEGVRDYAEERVWETDPLDADTDGDGFDDMVDRKPTEVNLPPTVEITSPDRSVIRDGTVITYRPSNYRKHITVRVTADSKVESFSVNAFYEQNWSDDHSIQTKLVQRGTDGRDWVFVYNVTLEQRGLLGDVSPTRYWVNVSDKNGYGEKILLKPTDSKGGVEVSNSVILMAGFGTTGASSFSTGAVSVGTTGVSIGASTVATGGAALLVVGAVIAGENLYEYPTAHAHVLDEASTVRHSVPASSIAGQYEVAGETVKLPEGFSKIKRDALTGERFYRGFGKAFIATTTALTGSQVEMTLEREEPTRVKREDDTNGQKPGSGPDDSPIDELIYRMPGTTEKVIFDVTQDWITDGGSDGDDDDDDDERDTLQVHYINVGKGQSILIQGPEGKNMLIDAGSEKSSKYEEWLKSELDKQGVSTIHKLVITHNHDDHLNFVDDLVEDEEITINKVYWSGAKSESIVEEEVLDAIDQAGIPRERIKEGDGGALSFEDIDISVLNSKNTEDGDPDANSIVLKLRYEQIQFLFTSDIRREIESELDVHSQIHVLTAAHHGSKSANEPEFLGDLAPSYVVASANPSKGHPDREVLRDLMDLKTTPETYITGLHGTVTFTVTQRDVFVSRVDNEEEPITPGELIDKINTSVNMVVTT